MTEDPLAALERRLTDHIAAVQETISNAISKASSALMARLDRLQTSVDAVRDDIAVTMGANDATRKAHDNTREETRDLSNQVAELRRVMLKHGSRLDEIERQLPLPKE